MSNRDSAHTLQAEIDKKHEVKNEETSSLTSFAKGDLLSAEGTNPVVAAKMHLVNNAIDEIGFTPYHFKLFCLNGFGYATDSLLLLVQSIIAPYAAAEFHPDFQNGLTIAVYVGMLVGALWWGLSADIIGRRLAFNVSLILSSIFALLCASAPNWQVLALWVALSAFGSGGNLVLDTAVFIEYLPSRWSWLVTLMACWWGLGQLIAGLFAWAFIPNFSCTTADPVVEPCTKGANMGWRYVWLASGAVVLVFSILRIVIIRLRETPKYLAGEARDEELVENLLAMAKKYNRNCSITLEQVKACNNLGTAIVETEGKSKWNIKEVGKHFKGLFETKRIGLSTSLIWLSWLLIGLAYPLYNVFLPTYLETRGASFGAPSQYVKWRDYALVNFSGIPSPILAGFMCKSGWFWGRRGTMIIGALLTMIFFFTYTQVRSEAQNLGFSCAINFSLNIYYATLYAYSPEVLPSAHRGTGNGVAIGLNRVMGIMSALVAAYANTATAIPIYICAALYICMAAVTACFPFEPMGTRGS